MSQQYVKDEYYSACETILQKESFHETSRQR